MLIAIAAHAATLDLGPDDDWCAAAAAAAPGDVLRLSRGDYAGPCTIVVEGLTLQAANAAEPPHIVYTGTTSNVIDVLASRVTLEGLELGPTQPDIDAVKIKSGSGVVIRSCSFTGVGGISIAANTESGDGLVIRDNVFRDLEATGIYIGCHDGDCVQTDVTVEGNLFDGVSSEDIGYAMELKLGSWGVVRGNVIARTKGPGIEIYGSPDAADVTLVERNIVLGSDTSAALEIGGGPAIVRNNIVTAGAGGGISSYDYGGRGLVRGVRILGNTVVGADAIVVSGWEWGMDLELSSNAVNSALPAPIEGIPMDGNVVCTDPDACWVDAEVLDFWPIADGHLVEGGAAPAVDGMLDEDFCGAARVGLPDAGAFERLGSGGTGALTVAFAACEDDAADPGDPPGVTGQTKQECTCGGAGAGGMAPWIVALLLPLRRVSRAPPGATLHTWPKRRSSTRATPNT